MTTYVRQDISRLEQSGPWDPYTLAYAKAVGEMQGRGSSDPTSWSYQAAIHGTYATPADAGWNMCQHGTWFFLPWHRAYILCLEAIVRAIVVEQGGPADWALPYWNWTVNRALPPAFREQQLPDGSPNPLYSSHRAAGANAGRLLPADVTATDYALSFVDFSREKLVSPYGSQDTGFGGAPVPQPVHFAQTPGALEDQPHNLIHDLVGGHAGGACDAGWMSDPNCAAIDPIFYLHHSNIDRIWGQWTALGGTRVDPTDGGWLDQQFDLFDAGGKPVSYHVRDVLTTDALGYRYDDSPRVVARTIAPLAAQAVAAAPVVATVGQTELGAATSVPLGSTPLTVTLELSPEAGDVVARLSSDDPPSLYLALEEIEMESHPGLVYALYLDAPEATEGSDEFRDRAVGFLSFFGVGHVHDPEHGRGAVRTFNVTSIVDRLAARDEWSSETASVRFVPTGVEPGEGEQADHSAADEASIRIGRVSLTAA